MLLRTLTTGILLAAGALAQMSSFPKPSYFRETFNNRARRTAGRGQRPPNLDRAILRQTCRQLARQLPVRRKRCADLDAARSGQVR